MQIEVSRQVAAPAAAVWEVMTDLASAPDVMGSVIAVEILEGSSPLTLGTRWRETRRMFGREATEVMAVTAMDPGRWYTVTALSGSTTYRSTLGVDPHGADASTLTMRFGATSSSFVSRALAATVGRMFLSSTRAALEADLADMARAAEARSR